MTAKISASADGLKVTIGNAAEDALEINQTSKLITALAPYMINNGQSLAANGYIKLSGGLIIQWGSGVSAADGGVQVGYAIPFSTAILAAVATVDGAGPSKAVAIQRVGLTDIRLWYQDATAGIPMFYVAIGY